MLPRPSKPLGEVAPIRRLQRTGQIVRTWRDDIATGMGKLRSGIENALPARRRARFDNDEHLRGRLPQMLDNAPPLIRLQFVEHIGGRHQVARRAIERFG